MSSGGGGGRKRRRTAEPAGGRPYTLSVALPGSIVANAQTAELKTYLAGQIARAAVVFNVDEVRAQRRPGALPRTPALPPPATTPSDTPPLPPSGRSWCSRTGGPRATAPSPPRCAAREPAARAPPGSRLRGAQGQFQGAVKGASFDADVFLARILQYLETPQYLRRFLFPVHKDLRYAGLLNPLDCPHHPRATAFVPYREVHPPSPDAHPAPPHARRCGQGVVVDRKLQPGEGSHVNVGLPKVAAPPPPSARRLTR